MALFGSDDWRPVRPAVCRRPGCTQPATDDPVGLCHRHRAELPVPGAIRSSRPEPYRARPAGAWRRAAACRGADPGLFFPATTTAPSPTVLAPALALCARCMVRAECLAYAVENGETGAVWGGVYLTTGRLRQLRKSAVAS